MIRRAVAVGVGHYLPERVVEKCRIRGIARHHGCLDPQPLGHTNGAISRGEGETTSAMAVAAARRALEAAGLTADDLDAVVVATSTPDLTFPSVATMVQDGLGMTGGFRLRRAGGLRRIRLCAGQCQRPDPLGTGDARRS